VVEGGTACPNTRTRLRIRAAVGAAGSDSKGQPYTKAMAEQDRTRPTQTPSSVPRRKSLRGQDTVCPATFCLSGG